jgi:ATP-dependent Zn protease
MTSEEQQSLPVTADNGETPPLPVKMEFKSRPRDGERPTRKPLDFWDRIKLFLLFVGAWVVMLWAAMAQFDPAISTREAVNQTLSGYWWLLGVAGLELLRQLHYVISEHWTKYHRGWTGFWSRLEKRAGSMKAWTRYRLSRVLKVLFVLLIIDLALAKAFHLPAATAMIQLPIIATRALPWVFQLAFAFFFIMFQFLGLFWFLSKGGTDVLRPDEIDTRFDDVKGQDSVLNKVKESIIFLENPEAIEDKGGKVPKGILLWGPPGTGKTLMAKAVAGETSKPFILVEPSAFMNMFVGVGALKVKSLFRKARKLALRHGGVIMFFDEADSLGNRGIQSGPGWFSPSSNPWGERPSCNGLAYLTPESQLLLLRDRMTPDLVGPKKDGIIAGMGGMGGGGMGVLPALLSEMDGMEKPRGFLNRRVRRMLGMKPRPPFKYRILTVMATNMPEALDPALLRPGRLDRLYKVGYPSKQGRIDTYKKYLKHKKHVLTDEEIDKLATITPYYGGAAIEDLVNAALINAIEESRDQVEWRDVVKAKQLKELGPPENVEYIERERHAVAVHEACHAVVAYRVRQHLTIDIATIEKGGSYLGMVASIPPEDQFTHWRTEFEADIMSGVASLAGERMFFGGDSSSGVSADLADATRVATFMEGYWGMGSTVSVHGVTKNFGVPGSGKDDEKDKELMGPHLGMRIESKLQELLERTEALLQNNRREVLAVAHALEANKTLTGEDVVAIIEGRQGPLLDGRPYNTPEFLQNAEVYHSEVVAAHREHAKVAVPLPALVPALVPGDGDGNAGLPSRPDLSGNGEVREPVAVTEGDGSPPAQAEAVIEEVPPSRGRKKKKS